MYTQTFKIKIQSTLTYKYTHTHTLIYIYIYIYIIYLQCLCVCSFAYTISIDRKVMYELNNRHKYCKSINSVHTNRFRPWFIIKIWLFQDWLTYCLNQLQQPSLVSWCARDEKRKWTSRYLKSPQMVMMLCRNITVASLCFIYLCRYLQ